MRFLVNEYAKINIYFHISKIMCTFVGLIIQLTEVVKYSVVKYSVVKYSVVKEVKPNAMWNEEIGVR